MVLIAIVLLLHAKNVSAKDLCSFCKDEPLIIVIHTQSIASPISHLKTNMTYFPSFYADMSSHSDKILFLNWVLCCRPKEEWLQSKFLILR